MPHKRTFPSTFYHAKTLRRKLTPAERKLWTGLRQRQLSSLRFRRQHAIGGFIPDFCCIECKLIVEVDGPSHADQIEYDTARTAWLAAHQGWRVVRFTNNEVMENLAGVLQAIVEAARKG